LFPRWRSFLVGGPHRPGGAQVSSSRRQLALPCTCRRLRDIARSRPAWPSFPFSVGIAATSQVVAKLMRRIPPRVCVTVGPFMGSLGLFWLSRLDDHSGYVTGVLGPIMVIAVGLGLTFVLSS
jgi:hypothetical protein